MNDVPAFLKPRTAEPPTPDHLKRTALLLEDIERRSRPRVDHDDETPWESASRHYNKLREDNMMLIDEVRSLAVERDVLSEKLTSALAELTTLRTHHADASRRLGSIQSSLAMVGETLVRTIREAHAATGEVVDEVAKYAPPRERRHLAEQKDATL
jgi:hypothetical protein